MEGLDLANINEVARIQFDGESELLRKPLGEMDHGGGAVLSKDSDEYKILAEMVDRVSDPVSCSADTSSVVPNLGVMDPVSTLRKASLQLAGRLPTPEEEATVIDGGEAALSAALDNLMTQDNFYKLVKEIYGDILLTGRYNQYDGQALGLLNDTDYPGKYWWNPTNVPDNMLTADQRNNRKWSGYGVAAEPLELISYVVRNNKPFQEILTADYTVVNWHSAQVYGVDPKTVGLTNPSAYYDFRPAKVQIARSGNKLDVPHSGVISTLGPARKKAARPEGRTATGGGPGAASVGGFCPIFSDASAPWPERGCSGRSGRSGDDEAPHHLVVFV